MYLDVTFNIFTTISVMNELSMLGPELRPAARLAKQYKLFPTEYSKTERTKLPPGNLCISKMIKRSEKEHFIIATQDKELKHKCRVANVPYIYIHKEVFVLEGITQYQGLTEKKKREEIQEIAKIQGIKLKMGIGKKKTDKTMLNRKRKAKGPNPMSMKKSKKVKKSPESEPVS